MLVRIEGSSLSDPVRSNSPKETEANSLKRERPVSNNLKEDLANPRINEHLVYVMDPNIP